MNSLSLVAEYLSLLLLGILAVFCNDERQQRTGRRRQYERCLAASAACVALDILTVWIESVPGRPIWLKMAVNTLYFCSTVAASLAISLYVLDRVYERVDGKKGLAAARGCLFAIAVAYYAAVALNVAGGFLFYFDETGAYCRGALNQVAYLVPLAEIALLVASYLKNAHAVGRAFSGIVKGILPLVASLVGLQLLFPDQLLNGTMAATADLILFLNFQSCRVEMDSLTELPNRSSFAAEISHRSDAGRGFQVMLVSLRGFSGINGVYGHEVGDALLYQAARRLEGFYEGGMAFRHGGDEFTLVLPKAPEAERMRRIDDLVTCLPRDWEIGESVISAPSTVAEMSDRGRAWTPDEVIERLEFALEVAKSEELPFLRFDNETAERFLRRTTLEKSIAGAVEERRFEVWFQPTLCTDTGRFGAAEALLRMRDENGRIVSPGEFIPIAEKGDLIDSLTLIAIHGACDLLQSGLAPDLGYVSVNLTARQLLQTGITEQILDLLEEHDVAPAQIKLEVTERMYAENDQMVQATMDKMRSCGLEFMVDDFGTGYSNLSNTLSMPFKYVKLDRSLISNITDDEKARLMVETLVPFFHKLGMYVIVEGVEEKEQADIMLGLGVDRIQGFYYAHPMDAETLVAWYRENDS